MALPKLFQRIFWHNNTTPAIQEDNLNAMSKGLSDVDDRVISLAGTIMEDVPQIQEDIEELEADMALIDTKIASATAEANRATTEANNAAISVISAANKALISEGWAKGTQNGSPVGSDSPYYHNNSEYFKEEARNFTPQGYQDLVDDVEHLEESITGEVVDSEPYVLRQGLGNLADMSLVGGSVAWNQLIQNGNFASKSVWAETNASYSVANNVATITASAQWGRLQNNVALIAGHKYFATATMKGTTDNYFQIENITNKYLASTAEETLAMIVSVSSSATVRILIGDRRSSGWTSFTAKNVMLIDLTALFGSSTIADYIYSLEQATAGAGVAWFRKYFSNLYYGYQRGKIESVNPSKRKVVGFNLWNELSEYGRYDTSTGAKITDSYTKRNANPIMVLPNKEIYIYSNVAVRYFEYDSNGNHLGNKVIYSGSGAFTTNGNTAYINIQFGLDCKYVCINISKTTGSPKNGDYVPYNGTEYPFDPSIQLRGVPKLVDNKLSYDGDIYKADGSITRKYGIVDMGTLNWSYDSQNTRFYVAISGKNNGKTNFICGKYVALNVRISDLPDKSITGQNSSNNMYLKDSSYTDSVTFKTAMSGVYLVYELATPTTESANAYQNPQRAFIDGTEEFIDAGVTAGTRDVSIPVGNNTTYQLNETLPPTEDYVDGALKFKAAISALGTDESGRTAASRAYTTGEFFYKDGRMYKVLTSIASGATFTVGTNCQQTTLFAELKALAQ